MISAVQRAGLICIVIAALTVPVAVGRAWAQSAAELSRELDSLEPRMQAALVDPAEAGAIVERLDRAETVFARFASSSKAGREELPALYLRLEHMLAQIHETYKKKKNDCINQTAAGGQCDYDTPEKLELQAAYPLAWLRFEGATTIYSDDAARTRRLLNEAVEDFTRSALLIVDPGLLRENLLGRAFCERELGKFDKAEYDAAIRDFKQVMHDGPGTRQYAAARKGLATTYAAMGNTAEALRLSGGLGTGVGAEMLQLQNLFAAIYATNDQAKRAEYHRQIVEQLMNMADDKEAWAVGVAAVARYSRDPIGEFGSSPDPFEKHLLANVLYSRNDLRAAARYFLEAARSGKYPRDFKPAAAIYEHQGRYDLVEQVLNELAKEPANPDAQWASYMRYKLARTRWERTGTNDRRSENESIAAAEDYLKRYPRGEYANETRFRLAESLQRRGDCADAVKLYSTVGGGQYGFAARFGNAECAYLALTAARSAAGTPAGQGDAAGLRENTIALLEQTLSLAPQAQRAAGDSAHKAFVHDACGRAAYMLAGLLQEEHDQRDPSRNKADAREIASLLDGYEQSYPSMSEHFDDVFEWRTHALLRLGKYDTIERDLTAFLERKRSDPRRLDLLKELGLDFWKDAQAARARGDRKSFERDAKLTASTYEYFENMVNSGKMQVGSLTGTLSILGQAYMAAGEEPRAHQIFEQVVKADPGSPDANAGLARIAESKNDYAEAMNRWTQVENSAAESDNLWYEARYRISQIYASQGNFRNACTKLAETRAEHPSLGTPQMKAKWDALQRKLCLSGKA